MTGKLSRKAAVAVQDMLPIDRIKFVEALEIAGTEKNLDLFYQNWLNGGYKRDWAYDKKVPKPAKVTLEEALQDVVIEWNN